MTSKVMLTMESRIHGDMYVRFGGGLAETYHRKVAKRCWPSLLVEIAALSGVAQTLGNRIAKHTFATTILLRNGVPIETVSRLLGHTNLRTTMLYVRITDFKVSEDMASPDGQTRRKTKHQTSRSNGTENKCRYDNAKSLICFACPIGQCILILMVAKKEKRTFSCQFLQILRTGRFCHNVLCHCFTGSALPEVFHPKP